jgi:hypothetical protein
MKSILFIGCCLSLFACGDKPKQKAKPVHKGFKPYALNKDYLVTDTGTYDTGVMVGKYGIVQRDTTIADTIDLGFGVKQIGEDYYLYKKLVKNNYDTTARGSHYLSLDENDYMVVKKGKKTAFHKIAKRFNDYFSSPNVINNKVYYWQLVETGTNQPYQISAAEYDPISKKTTRRFLINEDMGTDDSGYFPMPYQKKDTIYFDFGNSKVWQFSQSFKMYSNVQH